MAHVTVSKTKDPVIHYYEPPHKVGTPPPQTLNQCRTKLSSEVGQVTPCTCGAMFYQTIADPKPPMPSAAPRLVDLSPEDRKSLVQEVLDELKKEQVIKSPGK
jgi:hypothetical protein